MHGRGGELVAKSAPVGALSIEVGWLRFWPTPFFPPHAEDKILFRPGDIKTVKVGRGFLFQLRVILPGHTSYNTRPGKYFDQPSATTLDS